MKPVRTPWANYLADGLEKIAEINTDLDFQIRDYLMDSALELRQMAKDNEELMAMRGNSVLVPADKLKEMQSKLIELVACLKVAHDDTMDYLKLNNLDGEDNHWLVWARKLLK